MGLSLSGLLQSVVQEKGVRAKRELGLGREVKRRLFCILISCLSASLGFGIPGGTIWSLVCLLMYSLAAKKPTEQNKKVLRLVGAQSMLI